MSIVDYLQRRSGMQTLVTVISSLTGLVYFHWYRDGIYHGRTTTDSHAFSVPQNESASVEVIDTIDPDFDPVANAPVGYPANRTILWVKSMSASIDFYRVEQKKDADAWVIIGYQEHDPGTWSYSVVSPRLVDLASYQWQIIPVDKAGNDGTALVLGPKLIVRTPDSPAVSATFDPADNRVTFAEV